MFAGKSFSMNFLSSFVRYIRFLYKNLQSLTKFMKQCKEIKQWTGRENFEICFCVMFDH